jgi:hypothetical protein
VCGAYALIHEFGGGGVEIEDICEDFSIDMQHIEFVPGEYFTDKCD